MKRFTINLLMAAGALLACVSASAQAPASKYVSLLVPYAAGGPADSLARIMAGPFGQELGQTVIVENLGGASGILGAQKVLNEAADGRSLLQASPNEVILAPAMNPSAKLNVEDFMLIRPVVHGVLVLLAKKDLPVNNADELIALARKRADQPMSYGSLGVGSVNHLIMEQLQRQTGTRFLHVPYKGGAPMLQDLGGGQIDIAVSVYSGNLAGFVEKSGMRMLGQLGPKRSPLLPNVPTVGEGTALRGVGFTTWNGVMARKDIPEAAAKRLNAALNAVMKTSQVTDSLKAQLLEPMPEMSLEEAASFFRAEIQSNRRMLSTVGVKP